MHIIWGSQAFLVKSRIALLLIVCYSYWFQQYSYVPVFSLNQVIRSSYTVIIKKNDMEVEFVT